MGKVFILLVLVAGLVIGIMVAVSGGFSCSPGAYCPDGPPSVTSTGGHYDPPDPDIQQDYHPEPAELRAGSAAVAGRSHAGWQPSTMTYPLTRANTVSRSPASG
jgi:hypothetical protein